jgi:hypothetical protein
MNGGWQPTYMQRVEAWITLRIRSGRIFVSVLDGTGKTVAALPQSEVQSVPGGYRIHLNAPGQPQSPWFAIGTTPPRRRRPFDN